MSIYLILYFVDNHALYLWDVEVIKLKFSEYLFIFLFFHSSPWLMAFPSISSQGHLFSQTVIWTISVQHCLLHLFFFFFFLVETRFVCLVHSEVKQTEMLKFGVEK